MDYFSNYLCFYDIASGLAGIAPYGFLRTNSLPGKLVANAREFPGAERLGILDGVEGAGMDGNEKGPVYHPARVLRPDAAGRHLRCGP
jgi:hypothetical protein